MQSIRFFVKDKDLTPPLHQVSRFDPLLEAGNRRKLTRLYSSYLPPTLSVACGYSLPRFLNPCPFLFHPLVTDHWSLLRSSPQDLTTNLSQTVCQVSRFDPYLFSILQ
jgi:hypothetical protein